MKQLKIFIVISAVLLLIAAGAVGYVWLKLQQTLKTTTPETGSEQIRVPVTTPVAETIPAAGVKLNTSAVSEDQKAAAEKVGIDLDEVTITPEMVSCAENKLGSERVVEIMNGASPTMLESISLLGCL